MNAPLPLPTKVIGLLSRPRFGPIAAQMCMAALQQTFGLTIRHKGGPFWEQGMQDLLISAVKDGFDVAVTFDYDSIFSPTNFYTLLCHLQQCPEVDAVAAYQPMRGLDNKLLLSEFESSTGDEGTAKINFAKPIRARTAHFGLTLFRLDKLREMGLPWFKSTPSPLGTWEKEDGAEDADIYFWRRWYQAGNTLEVLPWVCVGQQDEVVLMPKKGTNQTEKIFMHDWIKDNLSQKKVTA